MIGSGCGMFRKGKRTTAEDMVMPEPLPGDFGIAGREGLGPGEGSRVSDVQFENVLFAYDSYQIDPSEDAKIQAAADFMASNPGVRLVTEGHCDERGSNEYNMSLGEHRADAVRAALLTRNIDGARVTTKSYGEEMPLDPGHGEDAWRVNRRVEFAFYR
jgi:peptidoglycan-associated lipoprotein